MMVDKPQMSVKEFVQEGYLQEINRTVLHPLGVALTVVIEDDGSYRMGPIFDGREVLEGFKFVGGLDEDKEGKIIEQMALRYGPRTDALGYWAQGDDL